MKTLTFAAIAALMPVAALAHDGMHVNEAYARSTNPMVGAVFLQLENHREVECTLTSVASDAAERVELHTHVEADGVMKMTQIDDGIPVAAGQTHDLKRGGDHIMMMGLTAPLMDGDIVQLTLDFGDCGTEKAEAVVDNQHTDAQATADGDEHAGH